MKCLTIFALLASATFAAYPNLQLAYRFQNSALDWSGNGRNGTVNGSGVYTTARGQQALYFDGTGDYVRTPSFGLSGTVVVFACWTRCRAYASDFQGFLGENANPVNVGYLWTRRTTNSDDMVWRYANGSASDGATATDFFKTPYDDVWLHMVIVCDYGGKKTYFYRNAVPFGDAISMSGTPLFPSTSRIKYIGGWNSVSYLLNSGYLQNVQLWTLATMPDTAVMNASVRRLACGLMPVW